MLSPKQTTSTVVSPDFNSVSTSATEGTARFAA
jgi:hypothetical protein